MDLITSYQDTIVDGEIVEMAVITPIGSPSGVFEPSVLRRALYGIVGVGLVTVDLGRLRWLSAGLLSALIEGIAALRKRNVTVSVVGMKGQHARVLTATGLSDVIVYGKGVCPPVEASRAIPA